MTSIRRRTQLGKQLGMAWECLADEGLGKRLRKLGSEPSRYPDRVTACARAPWWSGRPHFNGPRVYREAEQQGAFRNWSLSSKPLPLVHLKTITEKASFSPGLPEFAF